MSRNIIWIPGTGEPGGTPDGKPGGMLRGVADEVDRLAPGRFKHYTLDYWRQYAAPHSYGDSRIQGEQMGRDLLSRIGGARTVGFSMGATLAGNLADERHDVPCGYFLADPLRPAGANSTGMPGDPGYAKQEQFQGFGIGGQRPVGVGRWYSIPGDVITDAYPDSLIRDFADFSEFIGFADWGDAKQWMDNVLWKIREDAWQNLPFWKKLGKRLLDDPLGNIVTLGGVVARTAKQGVGYPRVHCSYGTTPFLNHNRTYLQEMARDIVNDSYRSEKRS